MTAFVADQFALRDNALTRADPRVKLLLAIVLLVCVLLSRHAVFPLALMAVCIITMLTAQVPPRLVCSRLAAPAGMVCVLVVLQSLLRGTTPLWTLPMGALKLAVTKEGLHEGCLIGSRVFGSTSVVLLLSMVTPAHRIFHALRWMHLPQGWVEIAILMYRYLFTLFDLALDITAAQRLRLGYQGAGRAVRSMGTMMGTVVIRSIDQARHTHDAMVLRGYHGIMPFGPISPLRRSQWAILILGGALAFGIQRLVDGGEM